MEKNALQKQCVINNTKFSHNEKRENDDKEIENVDDRGPKPVPLLPKGSKSTKIQLVHQLPHYAMSWVKLMTHVRP